MLKSGSKVLSNTIMDIKFSNFLILYQMFFSPQVKRSVIISNKYGIYELPNDLRLEDLRKLGWIRKISKPRPVPPPQTPPTPVEKR